jgi:hypothetical protein
VTGWLWTLDGKPAVVTEGQNNTPSTSHLLLTFASKREEGVKADVALEMGKQVPEQGTT